MQEMDMLDDVYNQLNGLSSETYGEFEYSYDFIAKDGDHNDGLCIYYDIEQYRALYTK